MQTVNVRQNNIGVDQCPGTEILQDMIGTDHHLCPVEEVEEGIKVDQEEEDTKGITGNIMLRIREFSQIHQIPTVQIFTRC